MFLTCQKKKKCFLCCSVCEGVLENRTNENDWWRGIIRAWEKLLSFIYLDISSYSNTIQGKTPYLNAKSEGEKKKERKDFTIMPSIIIIKNVISAYIRLWAWNQELHPKAHIIIQDLCSILRNLCWEYYFGVIAGIFLFLSCSESCDRKYAAIQTHTVV